MELPLTPQQRDAIHAHPGQPLAVFDDLSSEKYFIVSAPVFLHLQGLAGENDRDCHEQLRRLIQDGIDSPEVPADEAFARLRTAAVRLADPSR